MRNTLSVTVGICSGFSFGQSAMHGDIVVAALAVAMMCLLLRVVKRKKLEAE